jgi:hypothetical protein
MPFVARSAAALSPAMPPPTTRVWFGGKGEKGVRLRFMISPFGPYLGHTRVVCVRCYKGDEMACENVTGMANIFVGGFSIDVKELCGIPNT